MTKLYYTDPLVAAIMNRDFGIELQCEVQENDEGAEYAGGEKYYDFLDSDISRIDTIRELLEEEFRKIYIHPDSYHIFKPRVGDVIKDNLQEYTTIDDAIELYELIRYDVIKEIIQRHGKAFYTPKVEE